MQRNLNLSDVLAFLKGSGVAFTIEDGRTLVVQPQP
jgi:hypothetical protein